MFVMIAFIKSTEKSIRKATDLYGGNKEKVFHNCANV